jgi:hypothetical protein
VRTRLGALRAELLAALGFATTVCGGRVGHETAEGAAGEAGRGGADGAVAGSGQQPRGGAPVDAGDEESGSADGGYEGATPCLNPQPMIGIDGRDTGFVTCQNGFIHRREQRDCASIVPRPNPTPKGGSSTCTRDSDCAAVPNAYCGPNPSDLYGNVTCVRGCVRDEDCAPGQTCFCGTPIGLCASALDCRTDADCAGTLCTMIYRQPICLESNLGEFACQRPGDQCRTGQDCAFNMGSCVPGLDGRRCVYEGRCGG